MAQQKDRHLTTEQLSAFLDKQLSMQEQAACEAHLQSCQQCQGLLDDLRQTVALLHALPQPALPRSFVLPAEVLRPAATRTPLSINEGRRRVEQSAQERGQLRRSVLRSTLRTMSTIAAVIGFIFLLSAIPILHGGAASSTGGAASGSSTNAPAASSAAKTPQLGPHAATKPTSPVEGKTGGTTPQPSSTNHGSQVRNSTNQQQAASNPTAASALLQSVGSALDPTMQGGRAIDGALLIVLALLGFVLSRRWRRAAAT